MTERARLLALADRAEAATADEQSMLLKDAFRLLDPSPKRMYANLDQLEVTKTWAEWSAREERFSSMLQFDAYESAALLLKPQGWYPIIDTASELGVCTVDLWADMQVSPSKPKRRHSKAVTIALALMAGCLRAIASQDVAK